LPVGRRAPGLVLIMNVCDIACLNISGLQAYATPNNNMTFGSPSNLLSYTCIGIPNTVLGLG